MIDFLNIYRFSRFTKIGFAAVIIAALFKILHWPGANILFMIAFNWVILSHIIHFITLKPKKLIDYSMLLLVISFSLHQTFRILHWKYAKDLFYFFAASFVFYIISYLFTSRLRTEDKRGSIIQILNAVFGLLAVAGAILKIMHWPGANATLVVALLGLAGVFVVQSFRK